MTSQQAVAFIRKHGVVLEAARGSVPSLVDEIAGEPVRNSWWSHPSSQHIFEVTRAVRENADILVCRLIGGKITLVHRRLWPALVRLANHFPPDHLSKVIEVHTATGGHKNTEVKFPEWVPSTVFAAAEELSEDAARAELGEWIEF